MTTQRGDTVFVHVLKWQDRQLALPDVGPVARAWSMGTNEPVVYARGSAGLTLTLPAIGQDTPDRIVVLVLRR